jgi:hypothetical protein
MTGTLVGLLGLGGAIAGVLTTPTTAQAYTQYVTLFVPRAPGESYGAFLQKVEAIAQTSIQLTFEADPLTSEVIAKMVGENQGISIPILAVQVTRNEWQQRPELDYWSRYYTQNSELLDL